METGFVTVIIVGLLLYGGYQLWSAYKESTLARKMEAVGAIAEAEIIDRWSARGRFSAATFYVIYNFRADGQQFETQQQVSRANYDALEVGQRPSVKYLSGTPDRSARLTGQFADASAYTSKRTMGLILVAITGILLVVSFTR